VDVTETDKDVKICAEILGVEAKDIDVSIEDGTLRIRGEKKYEREENEKGQYRMEPAMARSNEPSRSLWK
jgi:HSP20 family protein